MDGTRKALIAQGNLVRRAQAILTSYLKPQGATATTTLDELLYTLNGPDAREADGLEQEALHHQHEVKPSTAAIRMGNTRHNEKDNIDRFIQVENIKRFNRLLYTEKNEDRRNFLRRLIAAEQEKEKTGPRDQASAPVGRT